MLSPPRRAQNAAIMPIHFGGRPLDSNGFHEFAERHDLWIVEDAAHAIGAVADGAYVGGSGLARTVSVFSFYPNKNLSLGRGRRDHDRRSGAR